MHDCLLQVLEQSSRRVRLVSRLMDERLGFPSSDRLLVFIPDLHLISRTRRQAFNYRAEGIAMLTNVCKGLLRLQLELPETKRVVVYQLGDLLDLWRERRDVAEHLAGAAAIEADYPELLGALRDLNCQFILGNHDFMLYTGKEYLSWDWKYYLLPYPHAMGNKATVLVLHGDVFDWVERLPLQLSSDLVNLFAPFARAKKRRIGSYIEITTKEHLGKSYEAGIQHEAPIALGMAGPPNASLNRFAVAL